MCWARCLLRSRSRARLLWARLVRLMRTSLRRLLSWLRTTTTRRLPRRTWLPSVSPRLPRLRRLRLCCVLLASLRSSRRLWTVRRSVTRRWLPSRYTSWASCKTAQSKNILCSSPVCLPSAARAGCFLKWKRKKLTGANSIGRPHLWRKNEFQNYSCFLLDDMLKWKCCLFPLGIENQIMNY